MISTKAPPQLAPFFLAPAKYITDRKCFLHTRYVNFLSNPKEKVA
jgi:hypothetical protein